MTTVQTSTPQPAFTSPDEVDAAVLAALASSPERTWRAEAIVEATGTTMLEGLLALARLTRAGRIERRSPGRYRHTDVAPDTVAADMRRRVLGTD